MIAFDWEYMVETLGKLLPYLKVTFSMVGAAMVLGLFFGFWLTVMKLSKSKLLMRLAYGYTTIIRSTPTIILLFLVFYGLPMLLNTVGLDISGWDKRIFTIIALTLFSTSVLSEIMRPAYGAVNRGQLDAAYSVGLTLSQGLRLIVIPQAFVTALPNFGNLLIALIHESALAYMIGTIDVMGQANVLGAIGYGTKMLEIYVAVTIIFWVLSVLVGQFVDRLVLYMRRSVRTI